MAANFKGESFGAGNENLNPENRGKKFEQFCIVQISEEEAEKIAGSREMLEQIKEMFEKPNEDPNRITEYALSTYAKLVYNKENGWGIRSYHYDGKDGSSVYNAVTKGYEGFLAGEASTLETLTGSQVTHAADKTEIFQLTSKVGVTLPLFNGSKLYIKTLRPDLIYKILGDIEKQLEIRDALKAHKPILAPNAEEDVKKQLERE